MTFVGIGIYILNSLLALFAFNVVVKQKKMDFIIFGAGYFIVAILGVYIFMEEYLYESIFMTIVFGTPGVLRDNILPKFMKNNINILRIMALVPAISLILIIFI